jgi:alkanesulfonate monooxygenase SsuD/methylene tetrahydromethanopterin reductase-like flavin-dependent oxidoreductase (luciferase family)
MTSTAAAAPGRADLYSRNVLKLGLFGANCSSGRAATTVPERWSGSWEDNLAVAQLADAAGIDFMLPIGRWRGYGGKTNFEGASLETITWATGLLAQTKRLHVFGTVHAPMFHPIVAAKQFATADHVGRGRFGLNLVCGWNQDEFSMFGVQQRDHDMRYAYGGEWLRIVTQLWTQNEPFDLDSEFFHVHDVVGEPKPYGAERPVVMNAGASTVGRAFAVENCDLLFIPLSDLATGANDVAAVETQARERGRRVRVCANGFVVCRPSRKEAEEYLHYYSHEHADWGAVDHLLLLNNAQSRSYDPEHYAQFRSRWAAGHGGFPVVGDPDEVAQTLANISRAGFFGFCFSFVNYLDEFPFFRDEVLPRLVALGVRIPGGED